MTPYLILNTIIKGDFTEKILMSYQSAGVSIRSLNTEHTVDVPSASFQDK